VFNNLGESLALLRQIRGLSQAETARRSGIGKSQLSKYENGRELPKLDSLARLLAVLEVSHFDFFYTLHAIDELVSSLGSEPLLRPHGRPSILNRATNEAFHRVIGELLTLYGVTVKQVLGLEGPACAEIAGEVR